MKVEDERIFHLAILRTRKNILKSLSTTKHILMWQVKYNGVKESQ
jgi:hypothetical protein